MITANETKIRMIAEPQWWRIALFDFVDDFRYHKNPAAVEEPFVLGNEQQDAILASVVETLCDELSIPIPDWLSKVPACRAPYFVSKMDSLKAFSILESPVHFRIRKIFVCDNFLFRV